jgi:D-alanyl-D-alanine carboxypeptidase
MKKRKSRLLLFVMVCAAMVIGYSLYKTGDFAIFPGKQASANGGAAGSGGQVSGGVDAKPGNKPEDKPTGEPPAAMDKPTAGQGNSGSGNGTAENEQTEDGMAVIAKPADVAVLVNKQNKLPEEYNPSDLVYPDVRFIFSDKVDKRKMRQEAAAALEKLFTGAENDGVLLAGVSAYRSHSTQKTLFERYVKRDGLEKARTYSAFPGTSEHETGLAIDVTGSDGKCAAADCFAGTKEAVWLEKHAHEYGFIIRYLKGKEEITGYQYEPWHLRYVGEDLAAELAESGETLEEHFDAVPVIK